MRPRNNFCTVFLDWCSNSRAPDCAGVNKAATTTAFIEAPCWVQEGTPAHIKLAVVDTMFKKALQRRAVREPGRHEASHVRCDVHTANIWRNLLLLNTVYQSRIFIEAPLSLKFYTLFNYSLIAHHLKSKISFCCHKHILEVKLSWIVQRSHFQENSEIRGLSGQP